MAYTYTTVEFVGRLVLNLCLMLSLVALCALARDLCLRRRRKPAVWMIGLLYGIMATVSMLFPVRMPNGMFFDCRTGVVATCAILHGPVAALACIPIPLIYRISAGGPGMWPGLMEIAMPALLGSACYWRCRRFRRSMDFRYVFFSGLFIAALTMIPSLMVVRQILPRMSDAPSAGMLLVIITAPAITIMILGSIMLLEQRHFDAIINQEEIERRMLHSQKMAALGQFSRRVAHNFLNHFTAILGNAQIAKDKAAGTPDIRVHMDDIIGSVGRMSYLAGELLSFSHPSSLNIKRMEPGKSLAGIRKMLKETVNPEVQLGLDVDKPVGLVEIDPDQIAQVIVHMAVNSVEAIDDSRGRLSITVSSLPSSDRRIQGLQAGTPEKHRHKGPFAILSVADNGRGMSPETCSHVFEPFFTTKERRENTGLGLATVYNIVQSHKGYVDVESREGKGTTFHIYLPIVEEPNGSRPALES